MPTVDPGLRERLRRLTFLLLDRTREHFTDMTLQPDDDDASPDNYNCRYFDRIEIADREDSDEPFYIPGTNPRDSIVYDILKLYRASGVYGEERELYFGVASVLVGRPRPPNLVQPERYLDPSQDLVGMSDVQFIMDMRVDPVDLRILNSTNVEDFSALFAELRRMVPSVFAREWEE